MRFVTTLLLIAATALGGGYWYWQTQQAADTPAADATSADLGRMTPADLVRIDLGDVTLEKSPAGVWQLPGGWPTRAVAVDALLDTLTGLRSRFAPLPLTKPEEFGLAPDQKPVTVKVALRTAAGAEKTLTLAFGEKPADHDNPFVRPTFVRIDDRNEVLRLAPGLLPQLRVSRADFLRKQLFPDVVRAKLADPAAGGELAPAPVPLLDAAALTVTSPDGNFELKRTVTPEPRTGPAPVAISPDKLAAGWELAGSFTDRVDPDKLRGVLAAVPELWVEQFLPNADPATTGLDNPERTVLVKSGNNELKLLIGKVSRVNEIKPPPPPPPNPLAPPPPAPQPIREEFRYAKLPGNPQIFEIKADRFADLFVKPADLRDPRLARFKTADVKSVAIAAKDLKLKFAKEKDAGGDERWKMIEPSAAPAEGSKIIEMLDKLDNLQARGPDVSDPADRKP
ncbi:MAG: DUF4340 domain-containing protein, partial [Gemmataceae bacterium]|nr:DUF4340 domain-containing protein [Gemmataceae bacterium]